MVIPDNTVFLTCAADRNFFRFLPTMINSVQQNTSRRLEVGIFYNNVEAKYHQKLRDLFPHINFHFWHIDIDMFQGLHRRKYLSPITYARVLMAKMTGWEKFIYLDLDTITTGDIGELFDLDIDDYLIAGCSYNDEVNAGVLLINGKKWNDEHIEKDILEYAKHKVRITADQGPINDICSGRILYIDSKWNTTVDPVWGRDYLSEEYTQAAKITHYITNFKPWNIGYYLHPKHLKQRWKRYQIKAGFPVPVKKEFHNIIYQLAILFKVFILKK